MLGLLVSLVSLIDPVTSAADFKWLSTRTQAEGANKAEWIWVQPAGSPKPTTENASVGRAVFNKTFVLADGKVKRAVIQFTADNQCVVTLNGKPVAKSVDWSQLQSVDVAADLRPGENTLSIQAENTPGIPGGSNPGGLIASLQVDFERGSPLQVVTGADWQSPNGEVVVLGPSGTAPWNLSQPNQPCPVFRKEFSLEGKVKKATLRVVGLGQFEFHVNGKKVDESLFSEPWSQYDQTVYYRDYDVTHDLRPGKNALGVLIGNSFWHVARPPEGRYTKGDAMPDFSNGLPCLLAVVLTIELANGQAQLVTSDQTWKVTTGPLMLSHVYAGEDYDATQLPDGWDRPGFDDASWTSPVAAEPSIKGLKPMTWPPVRVKEVFEPVKVLQPKPGVFSYVFPQNASAIVRFKVKGKRGQTIVLKPSEVMAKNGEVEQLNLWGAACTFAYTLRGRGSEDHQWLFTYHGFQYVELTGGVPAGMPNPKGLPVVESLELLHVRTDNPEIGEFQSSSGLYNKTHSLIDWAMRSNMNYVLTDCPHREKLGWLECAHLLTRTFAYRYDCKEWFKKLCGDLRDAQMADGRIRTVAPCYLMRPPDDMYEFTVEWGAAGVLLPWQAYEWYGDKSFLTENYAMMRAYVDFIDKESPEGIAPGSLGDWYDYGHGQLPGPSRFTPTDLTATACWAMCVDAVEKSAETLGHQDDAERFGKLKDKIKAAFLKKFYDPSSKTFTNHGSVQTGSAMALCAQLVPENDRTGVLQKIVAELVRRGYQQTSGDVGHLFLIRALAEGGRSDVLHKVYSRTGLGSYGGILAKGLTTLPETWDAITVGSNSLNHCMLGHVMEWYYGYVLGVRQAPGDVGWHSVLFAPVPGDLTHCEGSFKSPRGEIKVRWSRESATFKADIVASPRMEVRFVLPPGPWRHVTINGKEVAVTDGTAQLPSGKSKIVAKA